MSTSGLYRWAKLGWNLCCYACCILSLPRNTHSAPRNRYMKTWRPAENRKYITYRNASRWEPSHGHMQHVQNIGEVRLCGFGVMQSDRQTDGQQTYSSQYFARLRFYGAPCVFLSSDGTRQAYCLPVVLDYSIWWMFAFVMDGFGIYVSVHLKLTIHRVKWRQRIYGHDTIVILWV